jgi:pyruvate,water dikinase
MGLVGDRWIYWLEELGKEHLDVVGKKCANLAELMRAGFRVPPGFALGLTAYDRFMKETPVLQRLKKCLEGFQGDPHSLRDASKYAEAAEAMRKITESQGMPDDMATTIMSYYDELCRRTGIDQVPVSIRSAGPVSHPGQYETYLHIRGATEVLKNIIKVWSSTFNQRSLLARDREGFPMDFDPIGVAVIRMVDAKSAGVMFTVNPLSGDVSRIRIEANWGLGESVVSGVVTPDEWMVDKVTLEISHRQIRRKAEEYCVDSTTGMCRYASVPAERQGTPCLSDEEVIELAKIGKKIEQHFGTVQDIEWAIDRNSPIPQNSFMLQARAGQVLEPEREIVRSGNATDIIAGLLRSRAPHS